MSATKRRLPHGTIPFERITDRTVRDTVMKLNENIISLKKAIDELSLRSGSSVSGGGAKVDVDDELSPTSTNPVQNRVITEKIVEVGESVESISGRTSTLETGVSQLGNRTSTLETGVSQLGNRTSTLETGVLQLDNRTSILETDVSQLGTRTSSLEERAETSDGRIDSVENRVDSVEDKIPSQATSSNKLADKDFVNSSISTNTSFFRGTSATGLTETQFLSWANGLTKTNNDYVFWNTTDSNGNVVFKRYKYNGTAWTYEYALNNSSFTAKQWATLNSGFVASDKDTLAQHGTQIGQLETEVSGKVDKVSGKGLSTNDYTTSEKTNLASCVSKLSSVGGFWIGTQAQYGAISQKGETTVYFIK